MPVPHRRLAAIMFTDMVGYSARAQSDEAAALALLDRHNTLLRPIFSKFSGREVKTVGDAFLVEFDSALDAVRCAVELQQILHDQNRDVGPEGRIEIRIGIHVGDVVQTGGDVLGDAVNIASRIQPLATPGGICLTQQVVDQVANKLEARLERLPPPQLKNIRTPVAVYRVVLPWAPAGTAPVAVETVGGGRQLAVLPLANISPDPNDAYFADGLTEELISVLSQVRGLSVIARTSVMPYKTAPKSVAQVGSELGVDTVLEGSVRKSGTRLRITLQLIDVPTQHHIWASSYNREVDDVFAVQSDIAERTAEALRLQLGAGRSLGGKRRPTTNLAAYERYLRGLAALSHDSDDAHVDQLGNAIRYFEEATHLDPEFSEAYSAWGNTYVMAGGDSISMREAIPKARGLVARALELDPESAEAHAALANISFQNDNDWAFAEAEFRRAIELNPSGVVAYRFLGLMLFSLGRFDEAKETIRRAMQLDPGGHMEGLLSWVEFESGDLEEGVRFMEQARDKHPNDIGSHTYLGMYYVAVGRRADAQREADLPFESASGSERFDHALLSALLGHPEEARDVLARAKVGEAGTYLSATHLAMLHSALGETETALDLLEQDYKDGDRILWLWSRGVYFDNLRNEPRFLALLEKYRLPVDSIQHPPRLAAVARGPAGHARRRAHARAGK